MWLYCIALPSPLLDHSYVQCGKIAMYGDIAIHGILLDMLSNEDDIAAVLFSCRVRIVYASMGRGAKKIASNLEKYPNVVFESYKRVYSIEVAEM
jgi:hypothetical protein